MNFKKFVTSQKALIILATIYFVTRFINLTILPIFTDEAIYLYWAKFIETYKTQWFLPLTDGKPPLFVWIISVFLAVIPTQFYLEAGRSVAVLFGFVSLLGVYRLTAYLFPKKSPRMPVIASLVYIFTPYTFFYDRIILFDGPLSAALIWTTYMTLVTVQKPTIKYAILWGGALGIAFLLKSTALVYWAILPLIALLWARFQQNKQPDYWKKFFIALATVLFLSQVANQVLRFSSAYPAFVAKNSQFSVQLDSLWPNPLAHAFFSFPAMIVWMGQWMTWPLFIGSIGGIIYLLIKERIIGVTFLLLWLLPIVGFAIIGQQLFPRYILFTAPYLIIAFSALLHDMWFHVRQSVRFFGYALSIVCIVFIAPFIYALFTDPVRASMPLPDYDQYVSSHPSGYGLDKTYAIIDAAQKEFGEVTIITQGTFGLYPYAYTLRYWDSHKVHIIPLWPIRQFSDLPVNVSHDHPVFVIFKEFNDLPADFPLHFLAKFSKPTSENFPIIVASY